MLKRWIVGAAAVMALWPATAPAVGSSGVYTAVLHVYQTNGSVPPCRFTSQQLSAAQAQVDTYGQQYYADFIAAIQTALTAQASGACSRTHVALAGGGGGRAPAGPALPASVTSATSSGVPAPMIALGIAAAVLALAAALSVVVGRRGGPPGQWRHAWAEARYRSGRWTALAARRRR